MLKSALNLLALLWVWPAVTLAQTVPTLINYQGRLTDAAGALLATGDYSLTFNLFAVSTAGSPIWGPQVFDGTSGTGKGPKIPVVQGYFNVILGPVDTTNRSLIDAFGGSTRFLQITIGTGSPILPRQQILSAPYAITADKLGGGFVTIKSSGAGVATGDPTQKLSVAGMIESALGLKFPDGSTQNSGAALLQFKRTDLTGKSTVNATIPVDDTIPQNTEGAEVMTVSITPRDASHYLYVEALLYATEITNSEDMIVAALFRDSAANAIAAGSRDAYGQGFGLAGIKVSCYVPAGSTNATTFKLRVGGDISSSGIYINASGAPTTAGKGLGGVQLSYLQVSELSP